MEEEEVEDVVAVEVVDAAEVIEEAEVEVVEAEVAGAEVVIIGIILTITIMFGSLAWAIFPMRNGPNIQTTKWKQYMSFAGQPMSSNPTQGGLLTRWLQIACLYHPKSIQGIMVAIKAVPKVIMTMALRVAHPLQEEGLELHLDMHSID